MSLGPRKRRYLLAGTVDAVVAVYDTARATDIDPTTGAARHGRALATRHIPHPNDQQHNFFRHCLFGFRVPTCSQPPLARVDTTTRTLVNEHKIRPRNLLALGRA